MHTENVHLFECDNPECEASEAIHIDSFMPQGWLLELRGDTEYDYCSTDCAAEAQTHFTSPSEEIHQAVDDFERERSERQEPHKWTPPMPITNEQLRDRGEYNCDRCHDRGYVPNWSDINEEYGEPSKKPCPDCSERSEHLSPPWKCCGEYHEPKSPSELQ